MWLLRAHKSETMCREANNQNSVYKTSLDVNNKDTNINVTVSKTSKDLFRFDIKMIYFPTAIKQTNKKNKSFLKHNSMSMRYFLQSTLAHFSGKGSACANVPIRLALCSIFTEHLRCIETAGPGHAFPRIPLAARWAELS